MPMNATSSKLALPILSWITSLLAGCSGFVWNPPSEVFEFRYQLVSATTPGIYLVANNPNCTTTPRRLEDIARDVQAIGGVSGYNALWSCAGSYLVAGTDATNIRNTGVIDFGFDVREPLYIKINGTRTLVSGASNDPTGIVIESNGGLTTGNKLNSSSAEIYFGGAGPVFRCEGGTQPWHANIGRPDADTFSELTLTELDLNNGVAGGDFQCLARNRTDPNDSRLLIVLGGGFRVLKN
jgi:hypothetical protein